jgi:hypothetical protein
VRRQADEMRRLLPKVIETGRRLGERRQRLRDRADALRARKEVLKASYVAAHSGLLARETIASAGLSGDDGDRSREDPDEATGAAEARLLRDVIAQLERELGQRPWPRGLMDLRPGVPVDTGIRILFAVEPTGTVLLIAVLDGCEAVRDKYLEAILLSADRLREVRAGQAPEAAAHGYDGTRSFLEEFYPGEVL